MSHRRNMYVLSVIAGIFLPPKLPTGLLGINVGAVVLGLIEYAPFRRLKWI